MVLIYAKSKCESKTTNSLMATPSIINWIGIKYANSGNTSANKSSENINHTFSEFELVH